MARTRIKRNRAFMIVSGNKITSLETNKEKQRHIKEAKLRREATNRKVVVGSKEYINASKLAEEIANFKKQRH